MKNYLKENLNLIISTFFIILSGYVFHFWVGRKLGPEEYGLVISLLAIVYLISIFLQAIQTIITTKIAEAKAKNKETTPLLKYFIIKNAKTGAIVTIVFLLSIPLISNFLKTNEYSSIAMLAILILASFLLPVVRGYFQGMQQFGKLALTYYIEGITKIILIGIFLSIGGRTTSAIAALSLSFLIPFIIALPLCPRLKIKPPKSINYKILNRATMILAILALFYSMDLLLVKHYFSSYQAGLYSAASLYGKVIIFSALPIAMVLLPKSVEANTYKTGSVKLLKKSLFLISLIGLPLVIAYFIFPKLILKLSLGEQYLSASPLLGLYGLAAFFIAISYILTFYLLGLKKEKDILKPLFLSWLIEPIIIIIFHQKLTSVILAINISAAILTTFLIAYTIKLSKSTKTI